MCLLFCYDCSVGHSTFWSKEDSYLLWKVKDRGIYDCVTVTHFDCCFTREAERERVWKDNVLFKYWWFEGGGVIENACHYVFLSVFVFE